MAPVNDEAPQSRLASSGVVVAPAAAAAAAADAADAAAAGAGGGGGGAAVHTVCVHAGTVADPVTFGVVSPVFAASAAAYPNPLNAQFYPRYNSMPNQGAVGQKLAALEGAQTGLVFSSGMAAIACCLWTFLRQGDHAVLTENLYGGTLELVQNELPRYGIAYTLVAGADAAAFRAALRPNTRVVYLETPSNPLCELIDLAGVAAAVAAHNREHAGAAPVVTIADNTYASPINQRVVALGIDVAVHSGTKYLNGHSDLVCGAVATSHALAARILRQAIQTGGCLSPREAALLERSMKTLALRVQQQNRNALALATFLEQHPRVARVHYPGLPSHRHHALARAQMTGGFGGMLAFEVRGDAADVAAVSRRFRLAALAMSLGGVETTMCFPAQTSHKALTPAQRRAAGIADGLLRVSVGIEDVRDLLADFAHALADPGRDGIASSSSGTSGDHGSCTSSNCTSSDHGACTSSSGTSSDHGGCTSSSGTSSSGSSRAKL